MNSPKTRAERFLNAYTEIENYLRDSSEKHVGFKRLVKRQAKKPGPVRTNADALQDYADLRNAILHNPRTEGRVIADPRLDIVEDIERIRDAVLDPPKVFPEFRSDVKTVKPSSSIRVVIQEMRSKDYSQVPVKEGNSVQYLLTTNTIARWVGAHIDDEGMLLTEDTSVDAVHQHAEHEDNYVFLSRNTNLYEAVEAFQVGSDSPTYVDAALITHSGKPDETLLGIITASDLSLIQEQL